MKTLVIHPEDKSTDFLKPIYDNVLIKTVITHCASQEILKQLINKHDRILMMGHGSPHGLFGLGHFGYHDLDTPYPSQAIDQSFVEHLRNKECVFIWCNADKFVERYKLSGFYTGMFISEVSEAKFFNITTDQKTIDESNNQFASILGDCLEEGLGFAHYLTLKEYSKIAKNNEIAAFNLERLYYRKPVTEPITKH